jgi:hypothetical protein
MQIGTEILIERMNTHPEEFENGVLSKWARIMDMAHDFLPDEDKAAIKEARDKAKMDYFNGEVLATLAGEREVLGMTEGTNTGRLRGNSPSTGWLDEHPQNKAEYAAQQQMAMSDRARNAMQNPYPSGGLVGKGNGIWSALF